MLVVPTYSNSLRLRKRFQKLFSPAKNKYLYPLVAKPLLHVVVIVLIFSVTAANLHARTIPTSTGENSILFGLLGDEEYELIIETADQGRDTQTSSYMGFASGVSQRQTGSSDVTLIPVADNSLLVIAGGSAISASPSLNSAPKNSRAVRKNRKFEESYVVQTGDTISTIAASFGLSSSTILWANNLGTRDFIRPGQELTILPVDGIKHNVKKGETLSKIASKYDVDEKDIVKQNKLNEGALLAVATELIIPGATPPRSAPKRRTVGRSPTFKDLRNVIKPPSSQKTGTGTMIWPTSGYVITQYYGWRHTGVDIDGDYNSPNYAVMDGVVETAGWGRGYGIQIVINHQNGFKTRYAHMSKIFVTPGQRVKQGDVIGMVGTTGRSTGTHLHFEVYVNGSRVNPLIYTGSRGTTYYPV